MALDFNNDPLQELAFFGPQGVGLDGFFGGTFLILSKSNLICYEL